MPAVEIRVKGQIDPSWSEWLHGMQISYPEGQGTLLCGPLPDQAALYGLLLRLRDLGLALVSVRYEEQPQNEVKARTGRI